VRKIKKAVCTEQKVNQGLLIYVQLQLSGGWCMAPSSSALAFRSILFRSLRLAVLLKFGFNAKLLCLFLGNEIKFRREF
jgi:hypothetical protein